MIDKLYVFSEFPSDQDNTELSGNIDNEKRLEWTIDNETKQKLKNIHSTNNYNEVEEEIEIDNEKDDTVIKKKYNIQIDNNFNVKYNYDLIENIDIKNYNNKLILKDGYYYYVYIYKHKNKIFFDVKDDKLNLISAKSNPILGSTEEHSSMTIEHSINYKYINDFEVIGTVYLYKPLETVIKNNIYIIDVIYYNTIITTSTKYKLNFIFYNLEHYFDFKENMKIDTNQTITDDITTALRQNYEKINKYVETEKKYLQVNKVNEDNISKMITILDERFNMKNNILSLENSYIALKKCLIHQRLFILY